MPSSTLKFADYIEAKLRNAGQGAHFLGVTKKDLVAEAVKDYLAARREEIHRRMTEAMKVLDGSTKARVALLTGISPEDIDRLGGIQE